MTGDARRTAAAASGLTEESLRLSALSLGTEQASAAERRIAIAIVGVLLAASVLAVPFSATSLPNVTSFIALFGGVTATTDGLAAALLFGLYRIDGRRTVLAAASAYLLDALLTVPYIFSFPAVMGEHGVIGNQHSAAWLWLLWHVAFPIVVATGVLQPSRATAYARRPRNIRIAMLVVASAASLLTAIVTVGRDHLPPLLSGSAFLPLYARIVLVAMAANVAAVVVVLRRVRPLSTLHLWLLVALVASVFDTMLNAVSPGRYRAAWYVGKVETLTTASVVLLSLLVGWSSLYARATELAERLSRTLLDRRALREQFEREHTIAEALQRASLQRDVPHVEGTLLSAVYRPAERELEIGGDWYDVFVLDDGRLALSIGDVAGKGLAASVVMGRMRQTLRVAASIDPDPFAMLAVADRALRADDEDGLVTAFVAVVDRATGTLEYASAGHPPPLIFRTDGTIDELSAFGLPLGLRRNDDPQSTTVVLEPGDLLVAYTDGLVEVNHDLLEGTLAVRDALARPSVHAAPDPATALFERVADGDARDDVAIVTLSLTGAARSNTTTWRFDTASGSQAASARRTIAALLLARGARTELVASAELAFGELVGNAVRYAPGAIEVTLELESRLATLHVSDSGRGFTLPAEDALPADPFAESGRGLFIVRACATTFEVRPRTGGGSHTIATFELAPVSETAQPNALVPHRR